MLARAGILILAIVVRGILSGAVLVVIALAAGGVLLSGILIVVFLVVVAFSLALGFLLLVQELLYQLLIEVRIFEIRLLFTGDVEGKCSVLSDPVWRGPYNQVTSQSLSLRSVS